MRHQRTDKLSQKWADICVFSTGYKYICLSLSLSVSLGGPSMMTPSPESRPRFNSFPQGRATLGAISLTTQCSTKSQAANWILRLAWGIENLKEHLWSSSVFLGRDGLICHMILTSIWEVERRAIGHLPLTCQHRLKDILTHCASCSELLIRTHPHIRCKSPRWLAYIEQSPCAWINALNHV